MKALHSLPETSSTMRSIFRFPRSAQPPLEILLCGVLLCFLPGAKKRVIWTYNHPR